MRQYIENVISELSADRPVVLSAVIESSGSTPRKPGSCMFTFTSGDSVGTVGGGALEFEAQRQAKLMVSDPEKRQHSVTLGYSLSSDETGDVCMICGGDVIIHFTRLDPGSVSARALEELRAYTASHTDAWLTLKITEGADTVISVITRDTNDSSVLEPALLTYFTKDDRLNSGYFIIPACDAGRVIVFGGGHVGKALAPVLLGVGFSVAVFDDRPEYAKPESFPGADVINADFKDIDSHMSISSGDYIVIVTRGHKNDFDVLRQTLPSSARYVGCIGSRRKIAIQRQRLAEAGLSEAEIARLVNPIGVDIGAETPEEIAISIAAELIMLRAGGGKGYKKSGITAEHR